jgi:hypothetical protein
MLQNDLEFLRIKSLKHEVMVAPSKYAATYATARCLTQSRKFSSCYPCSNTAAKFYRGCMHVSQAVCFRKDAGQ